MPAACLKNLAIFDLAPLTMVPREQQVSGGAKSKQSLISTPSDPSLTCQLVRNSAPQEQTFFQLGSLQVVEAVGGRQGVLSLYMLGPSQNYTDSAVAAGDDESPARKMWDPGNMVSSWVRSH